MLTLPLEPTDDRADPAFRDAAGCSAWLNQLQLTNLQLAHERLLTQMNELNRLAMSSTERLRILELLRETASYVQEDMLRKIAAKPLPLNEHERAIFNAIEQLWQAMITGYQRGLQACLLGEKSMLRHAAMLCQRCLHYSGRLILSRLQTGHQPEARHWQQLHELYAFAEQLRDEAQDESCTASYVKTLLLCYANPAQMSRWQAQKTEHWLTSWLCGVQLDRSCSQSRNDAQPLAVDMSGSQGFQRIDSLRHHDETRYLAMVPISKLLRVKSILLQQGQTPAQVGLGDEKDSRTCLELLNLLHLHWCENRRALARRPAMLSAEVSTAPLLDTKFSLKKELLWQMQDENILGAQLCSEPGERIACGQLIGIRPENLRHFMLGSAVWVQHHGKLSMGVKYFPGSPEAVQLRTSPTLETAAFLLPALPALKTPASLIVPRGWFRAGISAEIRKQDGQLVSIQPGFCVEHGIDYERVSYKPVASSQ